MCYLNKHILLKHPLDDVATMVARMVANADNQAFKSKDIIINRSLIEDAKLFADKIKAGENKKRSYKN